MMKWEELVRKVEPYVPGEQPDQPDMIFMLRSRLFYNLDAQ